MTLIFWFIVWAMTLFVLGLLLWPLLKRQASSEKKRRRKTAFGLSPAICRVGTRSQECRVDR